MTHLEAARAGQISDLMKRVAEAEGVAAERVRERMAAGRLVIPANTARVLQKPCGIGEGMTVKVNANLGTSRDFDDVAVEMEKLRVKSKR